MKSPRKYLIPSSQSVRDINSRASDLRMNNSSISSRDNSVNTVRQKQPTNLVDKKTVKFYETERISNFNAGIR